MERRFAAGAAIFATFVGITRNDMRFFYHILIILSGVLAASCGKSDSFKVSGTIEGAGGSMVELLCFNNGAYERLSTSAKDGKFELECSVSSPAVAFLSVSGGAPLVELVVKNGVDIRCEINPADRFALKIKGDKVNELYSKFLNDNSEAFESRSIPRINEAVKKFVEKNPGSMASTIAVITQFRSADNEIMADSLLGIISAEARPQSLLANYNAVLVSQLSAESRESVGSMTLIGRNDSIVRFNPFRHKLSVLAFAGDGKTERDSILKALRALRKDYETKRLGVVEVSTAPDSATWIRVTEKDSATWHQVWSPGSFSAPSFRRMAISRVPYFVVVDSTGHQVHRGSSAVAAENFVRSHLK